MVVPSDFLRHWGGFRLSQANYSGGAGGTLTNLVAGGGDLVVNGATPTFASVGNLEGMLFSDDVTETIRGRMRSPRDFTIVVAGRVNSGGGTKEFAGGTRTNTNTWSCRYNGQRGQAFYPNASSGYTPTGEIPNNGTDPFVAAFTFVSRTRTSYCQTPGNTPVSQIGTATPWASWPEFQIGGHRLDYLDDTIITGVDIFGEPLALTDPTQLSQLLIDEEALF